MTQTLSESALHIFTYETPKSMDHPKATINLVRGGVLGFGIQNVQPNGGETNLHAHAAAESFWFVLKGKARFYDTDDHLFGEYGQNEGIGIPRASAYWFEAGGDENLEIAHVTVVNKNAQNHRLNFSPLKERQVDRHQGTPFRDLAKHHAKPMRSVKYESPEFDDIPKKIISLWDEGDMLRLDMQKIRGGGETNMHSHTGADSVWFVLAGSGRFYGSGDDDKFDLNVNDGIFIPHSTPYWFESTGSEPLEIFHIVARDVRIEKNERVNYEALKDWQGSIGVGGRDATSDDPR